MNSISKAAKVLCRLLAILLFAALIYTIVLSAFALYFVLCKQQAFPAILQLGNVEAYIRDIYYPDAFRLVNKACFVSGIIECTFYVIRIKLLGVLFKPLSEGKPFTASICCLLRKLAFTELIHGIYELTFNNIIRFLTFEGCRLYEVFDVSKVVSSKWTVYFDVRFVIVFIVLLLLSYVFSYGGELQQLSDETL